MPGSAAVCAAAAGKQASSASRPTTRKRFIGRAPARGLARHRRRTLDQVAWIAYLGAGRAPWQFPRRASHAHRAGQGVVEDAAGELVANRIGGDYRKAQRLARQREILEPRRATADQQRALELLVVLVERELEIQRLALRRQLPAPLAS